MQATGYAIRTYYSGRVQGVGFRYSTLQTAKEFIITGEVTNCSDGRVYLVAQGAEEEVKSFLKELEYRMQSYIHDADSRVVDPNPDYTTFSITL